MREIKFRGIKKRKGGWMYGSLVKEVCGDVWIFPEDDTYCNTGGDFYSENEPGICMVEPETVGQFTGLYDKDGKEIYEGDIVRWDDNSNGTYWRHGVVKFNHDLVFDCELTKEGIDHIFHYGNFIYKDTENWLEVIGSVYDNPELLKK